MPFKKKTPIKKEELKTETPTPSAPVPGAPPPPPAGKAETRLFQVHGGEKKYLTQAEAKAAGLHWKE